MIFKPGFVILLMLFASGCTKLSGKPFGLALDEILRRINQGPYENPCQVTEILGVPFSSGIKANTTQNVYSGPLLLTVMGTGQASATSYTDAFYVFTDFEGVSISPEHPEDWILAINGQAADVVIPDGQIPPYNPDHQYTFEIIAPGGALTFGVMDEFAEDNSGSFLISICQFVQVGTDAVMPEQLTQVAMVTEIQPTPTPSPMPQNTAIPLVDPTTTPVFDAGGAVEFTSIHMVSEMEGWGISGESILVTRDGARTWRELRLPPPPARYALEFGTKLYFEAVDANHAWLIYAPKPFRSIYRCVAPDAPVWYTSDGGQTWNASNALMHELGGMDCSASVMMADSNKGWLSIDGWFVGAGLHKETQFFRTTDGGKTWYYVTADWCEPGEEPACSSYTPGWLSERAFSGTTGWMLENLADCGPCYGNTPAPSYFVSEDWGNTWYRRYLPPPSGTSGFYEQFFFSEPYDLNLLTENIVRLKLASSQYDPEAKPEAVDYIYASEDGGTTWQTYALPISSEEMDTQMTFFDPDYGLLLGRTIWRTEDAGETWQEINTVAWDGQFSFVDRDHGWAIARSEDEIALVHTANGGETWEVIRPEIVTEE